MDTVQIDGETYIRARDAAEKVGYTTDYVGQLSRSGKIDAKQVGRAWYVRDGELKRHKSGESRSNFKKTRQSLQKAPTIEHGHVRSDGPHASHHVSAFRQRLLDVNVNYEKDEMPLMPAIQKEVDYDLKHLSVSEDDVEVAVPVHSEKGTKRVQKQAGKHLKKQSRPLTEGIIPITSLDEDEDVYEFVEDGVGSSATAEILDGSPVITFKEKIAIAEKREAIHEKNQTTPRLLPDKSRMSSMRLLIPTILVSALIIAVANVFLNSNWLYRSYSETQKQPEFSTALGVNSITTVTNSISR